MTIGPPRKIIHIDMDAFFASVEQRDNPALRGKPIAVGGSAKRGVVAAASYEARVFGVRSAMPSSTALRKCPDLIFVPHRFEVYKQVSRQIRAIFADYTDLVEPLSLDEAYLDVTENFQGIASATQTAKAIRERIYAETGLTASAGISYNKFLAKIGSDQNKPNGQCVITPDKGADFIAALPVSRFHGIGPVTASKMDSLGIQTGADLRAQELAFLQKHFGKSGGWYYRIARGEDDRPVSPDRIRKSSGTERTFSEDIHALSELIAATKYMCDEVWEWVEKNQCSGRTVTLKIKYADFQQITRSQSFLYGITSYDQLCDTALAMARMLLPIEKGIRLVGVTLSNLETQDETTPRQLSLI